MSHNQLNQLFQSYTGALYKCASRMINLHDPKHEDKVQDLVVLAYQQFISKATTGTIMSLPLLIHFMKLRRPEVQLEMRGYSRTHKKDVFNSRNYHEGKTHVYSFAAVCETEEPFPDSTGDPEDELVTSIDFERKLSSLTRSEQTILKMKISGYGIADIARALSIRPRTVKNAIRSISEKLFKKPNSQTQLRL